MTHRQSELELFCVHVCNMCSVSPCPLHVLRQFVIPHGDSQDLSRCAFFNQLTLQTPFNPHQTQTQSHMM